MKIIPAVLFLGIIALIAGSMAIVNSEFGDTMTKCYNGTYLLNADGQGCNASTGTPGPVGYDNKNLTDEYYTVTKGQASLSTVSEQQNTLAIIIVMTLIILALVSVFGMIGLKRL